MANPFSLVAEVQPRCCPDIKLYKWTFPRTGLQLVLIERDSPLLHGKWVVATETNDDSGCPFATQQLITSMGSEQYPYSNFLDIMSAKWFSESDAFTSQDHTFYRIEAAGLDAFANTLSANLDCILHPNITETSFLTEVYNIDANGYEGGTVFNRMQVQELFDENWIASEVRRTLYPLGSGYFFGAHGKPSAIRNLTWNNVRDYHAENYRAANMSLVVMGNIKPEALLEIVSYHERELPSKSTSSRPFVDSSVTNKPSPLEKNVIRSVLVPDSDFDNNVVTVAFIGPHITERINVLAFKVFLRYIEGQILKRFVDTPNGEALASNSTTGVEEYLETRAEVNLFTVPKGMLKRAGSDLLKFLESGVLAELDLSGIQMCIGDLVDDLTTDETSSQFRDIVISEFLYGDVDKGGTFSQWLDVSPQADVLYSWSIMDWKGFVERWIVAPAKVCVLSESSTDAILKRELKAQQQLAEIRATVDLNAAGESLKNAISIKDRPLPDEVLNSFNTPDPRKITFPSSKSAATPTLIASLPEDSLTIDSETQSRLSIDKDQV